MKDVYRRMKLMISHFEEKMDELSDVMNHHFTRLEHGARQSRLATEGDGQQADTTTRERTESAATAAQAMRGDCFSAHRVEPSPTTNSTSFGVKVELPLSLTGMMSSSRATLPHPNRVSHSRRCAHHQPLVAYFPPAKPFQLQGPL